MCVIEGWLIDMLEWASYLFIYLFIFLIYLFIYEHIYTG